MNCTELSQFIQVYVDGELDEADRREFEEHLRGCGNCLAQADYERRFKDAIRARIPKVAAPVPLRMRIVESLRQQPKRSGFQKILVWSSIPALSAVLAVVAFTWTLTSGFTPLVDEAVDRHSNPAPIEVNTNDSDEVEAWFRSKVNFHVALPRFAAGDMSLMGARLSHLAERQAALVRYRHGVHEYSLLVFSDPGGAMEMKRCQLMGTEKLCVSESRGYSIAVWRSRGLAYSLVGDLPPQEMIQLISSVFPR
jgi:anti-sigma factor (TIGR02949 family)